MFRRSNTGTPPRGRGVFVGIILVALALFFLPDLGASHAQQQLHTQRSVTAVPGDECQAKVIATDGTPTTGTPRIDPQQLCNALEEAERESDCMGNSVPQGNSVNAREECLDIQRHGCGTPGQDCNRIPDDQTYYTHR